jgi:F-type H+-transporting ATPase subunit a
MNILAADNPLTHVIDKPLVKISDSFWLISDVTIMLIVIGLVLTLSMIAAARRISTGAVKTTAQYKTQGIWANMVEATNVYLRNDVFRPILKEDTDRFTPLLWTFFWFILLGNLFGLIPLRDITWMLHIRDSHGHGIGGTATQSIWVTAALALMAFILINVTALLRDFKGYFAHLTAGTPWPLWFIMVPIEILGIFVKPFALAMRLFANMTGGHVVVAVMLMFVKMLVDGLRGVGYVLSTLPVLTMIGIYFLEVLVALIQAFVFTFLTCLFLGQLIVHEGGHHGGHEEHGHAPGPEHGGPIQKHPAQATAL